MAKQRTDTESVLTLVIDGKKAKTSVNEIRDTYFKLNAEINNMRKADNPKAYEEKTKELRKLKNAWDETRKEIAGTTKNIKSFNASFSEIAKGVFGGNMLTRAWDMAVQGVQKFVTANAELSDQMAGVIKTTGLNEEAVDRLISKFNSIDTRTARSELLGLAQVAGKLGYSAENDVEAFVRAADKIGVALGEDLGGTEAAINSIGKLVDIFQVSDSFGLEESLLKVGSAINELGASGSAKESYLIDFTQRLAGIAPAADIAMTDVLGLAATLDELGQQVESSSTAVGQFIVKMGADVEKFAKIAGMSVNEFSQLLKEDANEAFLRVLEASDSAGGGIEKLAKNMGLIEVAGARGIAALGVLSGNVDKLREKQDLANSSFEEGTSILAEFNNVNTTLGANLEKIWNRISRLWENSSLRSALTDLTSKFLGTYSAADKLATAVFDQTEAFGNLEREVLPAISQYDSLYGKVDKNKQEHQALAIAIETLSKLYPSAISEVDKYGNAIDVNTEKVRQLMEAERLLLKEQNKRAISAAENEERLIKYELQRLNTIASTGKETITGESRGVYTYTERELSNKDLQNVNKQIDEAENRLRAKQLQLRKLGAEVDFTNTRVEMERLRAAEGEFDALKEQYAEIIALKKEDNELSKEQLEIKERYEKATGTWKGDANSDDSPTVKTEPKDGGSSSGEKNKVDTVKKEQGSLKDFLAKNANDVYLNSLEADKKELESIRLKYEEKRELAHGDTELLSKLAGQQIAEINQLQIKNAKEEEKLDQERLKKKREVEKQITDLSKSKNQLEIENEQAKYDALIEMAKEYGISIEAITIAWTNRKKEIEDRQKADDSKEELKKAEEIKSFRIELAKIAAGAVTDIWKNSISNRFDAERAALEKQREEELSNENLTQAQRMAINKKYDAKKRALQIKEFNGKQMASISEAIINTAIAISEANPNIPLMALAGATGAAQVAVIASQKPPQYAKGGFIPNGPSHEHGGIDLWDRRRQQVIGNIEGGEPILSKETYANNKQVIDELLYASQRRAGASIQLNPDVINSERMVRNGGTSMSAAAPIVNVSSPGVNLSSLESLMNEMIIAQREANDKEVILSTRLLEEETNKQVKLRNSVNA